jgi:hypothetical protein
MEQFMSVIEDRLKTIITMLPSHAGRGYNASIFGEIDDLHPDGWNPKRYPSLSGVAVIPAYSDGFTKTAVRRLKILNGVVFLTSEEAASYKETEGRYWLWKHGYPYVEVTKFEKFRWKFIKPQTPISDSAQEAHYRARQRGPY